MAFFNRPQQEIVSNSIERLRANTNITQLSPGGKTRFLLESFSEELAIQHKTFDENLMKCFIDFADDRFLIFIGDMLNTPILESTFAESGTEDFMFYVSSGTFGDINGGLDISIPSGTTVSTVAFDQAVITPGLEEQEVVEYVTVEDVTCPSDSSFINVQVRASIEGSFSNVSKNTLTQHNFTNYTYSSSNRLRCTNRYAISNGEDRESPESYRFRLRNIFAARQLATYACIRLAALSVPGVSDIKEVTCEQGVGSYSIYIKSTTPTVSPTLLREVSSVCYAASAFGIRPFILAPNYIGMDFVASVNWASRATTENIAVGYINIRNALENYLNRTDIGQEVYIEEIINTLVRSTPLVSNIGTRNSNSFERVYLYRSDPSVSGSSIRSLFYGDKITPLYNERVILETSGRYKGIQFLTRQS